MAQHQAHQLLAQQQPQKLMSHHQPQQFMAQHQPQQIEALVIPDEQVQYNEEDLEKYGYGNVING